MRVIPPLLLLTVLALTGCAAPAATAPTATPEPTSTGERAVVDWDAFPPEYQRLIDEDTAAGNCDALQETFHAARDDVPLLTYIDEALEIAGCY